MAKMTKAQRSKIADAIAETEHRCVTSGGRAVCKMIATKISDIMLEEDPAFDVNAFMDQAMNVGKESENG